MSKVYFLKIKDKTPEILEEAGKKISKLFSGFFKSEDSVAIKLHFGAEGNTTHLSPVLVKSIYDELKGKVKKTALVECSILYKGERSFASSHKKLAIEHGFGFAPIDILDGEKGQDEMKIPVDFKHFKEVKIGAGLKDYNAILCLTHFKGHGSAGIGGSLKNIGMGLGSKAGKLAMHDHYNLRINPEVCQGCGNCQKQCGGNAIFIENGKARIDRKKCLGCGLCISVCPYGAVERPMEETVSSNLQERIVEYAAAALKGRKNFFVNALLDITQKCDCLKGEQVSIMPDIGILASEDIVSIEQVSLDLTGKDKFEEPKMDPQVQIDYAEKLGMGEKKYELIEIS